jgi:hypothetical protein
MMLHPPWRDGRDLLVPCVPGIPNLRSPPDLDSVGIDGEDVARMLIEHDREPVCQQGRLLGVAAKPDAFDAPAKRPHRDDRQIGAFPRPLPVFRLGTSPMRASALLECLDDTRGDSTDQQVRHRMLLLEPLSMTAAVPVVTCGRRTTAACVRSRR